MLFLPASMMTIKERPPGDKETMDAQKDSAQLLRHDLEKMIERRMRAIYGDSFEELQNTRMSDHSARAALH